MEYCEELVAVVTTVVERVTVLVVLVLAVLVCFEAQSLKKCGRVGVV